MLIVDGDFRDIDQKLEYAEEIARRLNQLSNRESIMNEDLYEKALKAIEELFSDTSVSQREARKNLNGLISEIETMIDTLEIED